MGVTDPSIAMRAGVEEDFEVTSGAFHKAFEDARPQLVAIPGLQEFAASIWNRRRRIASPHDPLLTIFDEVRALITQTCMHADTSCAVHHSPPCSMSAGSLTRTATGS